jgi:hypothetical protein
MPQCHQLTFVAPPVLASGLRTRLAILCRVDACVIEEIVQTTAAWGMHSSHHASLTAATTTLERSAC